jgi:hypothetical protein
MVAIVAATCFAQLEPRIGALRVDRRPQTGRRQLSEAAARSLSESEMEITVGDVCKQV